MPGTPNSMMQSAWSSSGQALSGTQRLPGIRKRGKRKKKNRPLQQMHQNQKPAQWLQPNPHQPTQRPQLHHNDPAQRPPNDPAQRPPNDPAQWPLNDPTQWPPNDLTQWLSNDPTQWPSNDPTQWPPNDPTQWPPNDPTQWPPKDPTQWPPNDPTQSPPNDLAQRPPKPRPKPRPFSQVGSSTFFSLGPDNKGLGGDLHLNKEGMDAVSHLGSRTVELPAASKVGSAEGTPAPLTEFRSHRAEGESLERLCQTVAGIQADLKGLIAVVDQLATGQDKLTAALELVALRLALVLK
ncbi:circumsporozoite protein-like isoform X1 [Rhinatrema bivittatum]|uniref:circumsporozoite protein-like isoform X1 n=1 Tax=Rhinatrema bivittatum TaxID=194408 RepID=UPI001128806C|nr:circumsporozoite protein-like isoform X1 [Rhinatrema bivittatum]